MRINIKSFILYNIIDTCSIWNLLSSDNLYNIALTNGSYFSCTEYVLYECLYKPRSYRKEEDERLKEKLKIESSKFHAPSFSISIDDLQSITYLVFCKIHLT